jgi:hypothetical protein|tara:strand:- start:710 stop:2506 length:1797 start_codon:yes stop_codon:yes gene_type:complete
MPKDSKKTVAIDYTSKDFSSIRDQLTQVAERFYPDTFQDFSEASFGAMMLDAVAYVGDQVSFYLDYNVNETFLDTSYQRDNVIRHGRILGYKDSGRPSTYGKVAMFVLVPASETGLGPDIRYIPVIKRGTRFTSQNGLNFVLTDNVDMAESSNPVVVATTDSTTGAPTQYAIKSYGNVVSGFFNVEEVECGAFERFKTVQLNSPNVSEIISVFDSDGNEYFEVEYLSQDTVFKELSNKNYKNDNTPSVIKPMLVNRKFVTVFDGNGVTLQFGSGDELAAELVADPQDVAMDIFGKNYVTDTTFDPSRLVNNKYYGIVPQNTTLTIAYRQSNPLNSNVAATSLNTVASSLLEFEDVGALAGATLTTVRNSLEVINEEPIMGNVSNPSTAEIKQRIYDTFPTQNRAVTQQDYENLVYRMPAKFGSIKRCSVQKDPDSQKRNLNVYVVSEDPQRKLINTNTTIKTNLKTWLNHYRMINDTIDILDPFIINFGINFIIKPERNVDKFKVLDSCVVALSNEFSSPLFIGESISKSNIFNVLNSVSGVNDVVKVQIINKTSVNYSNVFFSISDNVSPDGDMIVCPKNAIFEMKFPEVDIKGKLR